MAKFEIIDTNTWIRKSQFDFFSTFLNPDYGFNKKIDVTTVLEYSKETKTSFFINFLYVTPKFRKQGYGKKLVELSSNQKSTKLNCLYREEKARSFYENLGFEPEFIVYRKIN